MTDYFVRKTGSNSNDGTNPDTQAWLTIDNAANNISPGDTVYVGAGVYRELVTMDTTGTSGNVISFIADVDGSQTGDPGLVVISASADEESASVRDRSWDFGSTEFITVRGFVILGGSQEAVRINATAAYAGEQVTIEDCVIRGGSGDQAEALKFFMNVGDTPATNGVTVRRCHLTNPSFIVVDENASAEENLKMVFESCVFSGTGQGGNSNALLRYDIVTTSSFHPGGIQITNCTFFGAGYGITAENPTPGSPTNIIDVRNCFFFQVYDGIEKQTTNDGFVTSDYNSFCQVNAPLLNVTTGANDDLDVALPPLLGGFGDLPLYRFWGWSPYRPFEPISFADGTDDYTNHIVGSGSTSAAPAFDLYNEARPMGQVGESAGRANVDDRGGVEARVRPEKETTTVRTGSNAIRFEGAGYHDFFIPVDASSTTVSIYGRYDSNHAGSLPILEVLNISGVADQSDVMVAAANTWEELTATFTPTAQGVCRVRVRSRDTSTTGTVFFDDLTVS